MVESHQNRFTKVAATQVDDKNGKTPDRWKSSCQVGQKLENGTLLFVLFDFIWYKNNLYY